MGEEIKMTMDKRGNFDNFPWEMSHVSRSMRHLMEINRENYDLLSEL